MRRCAICKRSSGEVDTWYVVTAERLVGADPDEWQESGRTEVCSWSCLSVVYMTDWLVIGESGPEPPRGFESPERLGTERAHDDKEAK